MRGRSGESDVWGAESVGSAWETVEPVVGMSTMENRRAHPN